MPPPQVLKVAMKGRNSSFPLARYLPSGVLKEALKGRNLTARAYCRIVSSRFERSSEGRNPKIIRVYLVSKNLKEELPMHRSPDTHQFGKLFRWKINSKYRNVRRKIKRLRSKQNRRAWKKELAEWK